MVKNGSAANGRWKGMNRPPKEELWAWITETLLFSPAFVALPAEGHKILHRLMAEHATHSIKRNGRLVVTYDQFVEYGLRREVVRRSLPILVGLGLVAVTADTDGKRNVRPTNFYRLTWLASCDGLGPTNEWTRFETIEQARQAVEEVLAAYRSKGKNADRLERSRALRRNPLDPKYRR
jgi:hypothetical protein